MSMAGRDERVRRSSGDNGFGHKPSLSAGLHSLLMSRDGYRGNRPELHKMPYFIFRVHSSGRGFLRIYKLQLNFTSKSPRVLRGHRNRPACCTSAAFCLMTSRSRSCVRTSNCVISATALKVSSSKFVRRYMAPPIRDGSQPCTLRS